MFAYPSLYEGFGLPILEAFKAKCPILLSDTECFREIATDAAQYFRPNDLDDLVDTLTDMLTNPALRTELVAKGTRRLSEFSLKKSIDQTLDVYKSLA